MPEERSQLRPHCLDALMRAAQHFSDYTVFNLHSLKRAELLDYIGSVQCEFRSAPEQPKIQKTTLYFLCKFIDQDLSKRSGEDIEGKTKIEWHTRDFLIPKMKEQALKYDRADIDESSILEKISM
jgi:hypothetical protein